MLSLCLLIALFFAETQGLVLSEFLSDKPAGKFIVVAHRGASQIAPENTIAAFQKAIDIGANGIETDVVFTKDNVPVVAHQNDLSSYTNTEGSLLDRMNLADAKRLDVGSHFSKDFEGERIPTLEEALVFLNGKVDRIYLHDKKETDYSGGLANRLSIFANVIRKSGMKDKIVVMVEQGDVSLWKKHAPDINLLQCWTGQYFRPGRIPIDVSYHEEGLRHLGIYHGTYATTTEFWPDRKTVAKYPEAEFTVFTINEKALMKQYIDAGFSAVGTDNPALLLEALEEHQFDKERRPR